MTASFFVFRCGRMDEMVTVGIDKLGFQTSDRYVAMTELARKRNVDPNKYLIGIGQTNMAVIPPDQDVVTMASGAARQILTEEDKRALSLVIVATESGIDNSKAAAMYVAELLQLSPKARVFEIKQACYGATAGLQMARDYVQLHPTEKALVVGADIARYGLKTPGEPTQGGGAVAMLVSANPRILALNDDAQFHAEQIMDFWRPLNHTEALVDGKYSSNVYLDFFKTVFTAHQKATGNSVADYAALLFHMPYTKMGLKGVRQAVSAAPSDVATHLLHQFEAAAQYSRQVGNLYTGSLYLSLLSWLHNGTVAAGDVVGLFSYGSGAQGEFFTARVQPTWQDGCTSAVAAQLAARKQVSVAEYEALFTRQGKVNSGADCVVEPESNAPFWYVGTKEGKRLYRVNKAFAQD